MTVDINKIKIGDPLIVKIGDIKTFETYKSKKYYPGYNKDMQKYNGTIGIVEKINLLNNRVSLSFADGDYWIYFLEWVSYFEDGIQEVRPYESPEPEYKFKVGDTVFIKDVGGEGNKGYGKVVYGYRNDIGVCHYTSNKFFHTCFGACADKYGWIYMPKQLELAEFNLSALPIN